MKQDLSLKKLKGIKPKGVKTAIKSTAQELLELSFKISGDPNLLQICRSNAVRGFQIRDPHAESIYKSIEEKIKDIDFNESDLKKHIPAVMIESRMQEEKTLVGIYTGALLHILTKRNKKQNKRTFMHIDGKNQVFDYLFYQAKSFDTLVLTNLSGHCLCRGIASKQILPKRRNLPSAKTVKPENSSAGNLLICAGTTGDFALSELGKINLVVGYDMLGQNIFKFGVNPSSDSWIIGVKLVRLKGEDAFLPTYFFSKKSDPGFVYLKDIENYKVNYVNITKKDGVIQTNNGKNQTTYFENEQQDMFRRFNAFYQFSRILMLTKQIKEEYDKDKVKTILDVYDSTTGKKIC